MKKRMIAGVLAVTMLLLGGCGKENGADPTNTTNIPEPDIFRQNVTELASQRTLEYDGEPWSEYDPNRQVYAFTYQYDTDLFPGYVNHGTHIYLFSKAPLNTQEISLQMQCETEYTLQLMGDYSEYCRVKMTEATKLAQLSLFEYQYYAMQGIDWKALGQIKALAKAAYDLAIAYASDSDANRAYMDLYSEYQAAYEDFTADYHTQYQALKTESIPQFYFYHFIINFTGLGKIDETVESAELLIDGERYPLDIGRLRLHKTAPQILLNSENCEGISNYTAVASRTDSTPFSGGYGNADAVFSFTADQDLTLTGVQEITDGAKLGLLGARVQVTGKPDFFWDMQQPIDVEAGAEVAIDLYFKDPFFEDVNKCTATNFLLEYQLRDQLRAYGVTVLFERSMFMWDIYLMAFEGCSIEEYYAYILAPYENDWLEELPEAWLK